MLTYLPAFSWTHVHKFHASNYQHFVFRYIRVMKFHDKSTVLRRLITWTSVSHMGKYNFISEAVNCQKIETKKGNNLTINSYCTFHHRICLQDLLFNPWMLTTDGCKELQNQLGALRFASARLSTANNIAHRRFCVIGHTSVFMIICHNTVFKISLILKRGKTKPHLYTEINKLRQSLTHYSLKYDRKQFSSYSNPLFLQIW